MASIPKYLIKRSGAQFYFNLHAANFEKILTSEMYDSKQGCEKGIASCRIHSQEASRFKKNLAVNGQFYFVLSAPNNEKIGRSETYESERGMEKGVKAVMEVGAVAGVEDAA